MDKILSSEAVSFIVRLVLLVIMIPLIFIALFFLGNAVGGDMKFALELDIKNSNDVTLTYSINGAEKNTSSVSVSHDVGDSQSILFKVPKNDDGVYKINFGDNTERIALSNIKFTTFFSERVVEAEELSAFFTEKVNIGTIMYSGGLYLFEDPTSGALISNIDPIKPLPSKLFSIVLLSFVSFILAIILSGLLKRFIYGILLGKTNLNYKIGSAKLTGGIATALVLIFSISVMVISGTPKITFDDKSIIKETPKKSTQGLKDLLLKQEEERAVIQSNKPPEVKPEYVIEPIPLKRDVPYNPDADYNTPKCGFDAIYEGNFPIETVLTGKDDKDGNTWLFFAGINDGNTVKDFTGETFFTEAQLKKITTNFVNQAKWLEEQGIKFYITVPPNKNTIYPEYMPDSYIRGETNRLDQLINYLHENTEIVLIDLREDLLKAKEEYPDEYLYYNLDTHWNNHGGFVAYRKIVETIKKDFPTMPVMSKSDYQIDYFPAYMKDMAYYVGWYDTFPEEGPVYTKIKETTTVLDAIETPDDFGGVWFHTKSQPNGYHDSAWYCKFVNESIPDAPKLFMLRDSFSIATINFLKESFSESTFRWTTDFDKKQILQSDPDVVVFEMVERLLGELLRKNIFKG